MPAGCRNPRRPPTQFGPYEVYERLGHGRHGDGAPREEARHRGLRAHRSRSSACSRTSPRIASFVESFIREAKVASLLAHPNIAQVYDFGRIGGVYYIAMELVAGFDVRKLLRYANRANEPIPLPVVLSILGELCDALEYAHTFVDEQRHAAQHRPPRHLAVEPDRRAHRPPQGDRLRHREGDRAASSTPRAGMVKGKLGYMSPEAALGMPVGAGLRHVLRRRRRVGARHGVAAVLGAHRLRDDAADPRGPDRAAVAPQPACPPSSTS